MALRRTVKTYPLMRIFLLASAALLVAGLFASKVATDPDAGDKRIFLYFVAAAITLPFLSLAFPRRADVTVQLPTDQLARAPASELEGILRQLDQAKAKGEIPEERYRKARASIEAALKAKK